MVFASGRKVLQKMYIPVLTTLIRAAGTYEDVRTDPYSLPCFDILLNNHLHIYRSKYKLVPFKNFDIPAAQLFHRKKLHD